MRFSVIVFTIYSLLWNKQIESIDYQKKMFIILKKMFIILGNLSIQKGR